MPTLNFELLHEYDAGKAGITIPLALRVGSEPVKVRAKLDTGSTYCVFRRELGEELGLTIEQGTPETISTATGSFTAYGHSLMLEVLGFELEVVVYFAAHYELVRNVLGRFGFMQQLRLGIVDYEGRLYIGRYDLM